jgi:hypothetical protein
MPRLRPAVAFYDDIEVYLRPAELRDLGDVEID